jgi:hypothetical protein
MAAIGGLAKTLTTGRGCIDKNSRKNISSKNNCREEHAE